MIKDLFKKIKALLVSESPRLIDEFRAIEEKTVKEITPEIEKIAVEIKNEVVAEVKKRGRKKKV